MLEIINHNGNIYKVHDCVDKQLPYFLISSIHHVIADGKEMEKCLEMTGKKVSHKNCVHFFNDEAKFIVANW